MSPRQLLAQLATVALTERSYVPSHVAPAGKPELRLLELKPRESRLGAALRSFVRWRWLPLLLTAAQKSVDKFVELRLARDRALAVA